MNRIAIIDLGTNTFHLLIVEAGEKGYKVLHRDYATVKIGKAGINEGIISESAFRRAVAAMRNFKNTMDEYGVSSVYAFATSAVRNATNGAALATEINSLTGIEIQIITGDQEADLIYEGVKAALDLGKEANLIMDIGAGSVELIIADQQIVFWKQSFEIGGQRLLEKFQRHDPIAPDELKALDDFFQRSLTPLFPQLEKFNPRVLIGSSGTFDTLSDIFSLRRGITRTSEERETALTLEGFHEIYGDLIRKNRDERMRIKGMIEMRVDMIVVACSLIHFLLDRHAFDRIRVSTYALKEGVLSMLSNGKL
jgi:exopolyphosphatase/guanosine-5'-triphosphate,3'-diphosphate pyrophosphatase